MLICLNDLGATATADEVSAMKYAIRWFVLGLLLLQAHALQAQQGDVPVQPTASDTIPFHLGNGFLLFVEGRIGNLAPLKFILDTGATQTILDARIADKLSLRRQKGKVLNYDRSASIEWAVLPELQIGPLDARNVRLTVGDLKEFTDYAAGVDAIIGLDVLGRLQSLRIDYDTMTLSLKPAGNPSTSPQPTQAFTVALPVQNHVVYLVVDTALQGILLYQNRVWQLKFTDRVSQVHIGRLLGEQAKLSGVRIGPKELQTSVLILPEAPRALPTDIDGYMGIDALNARLVELDFAANTLRWQ